MRRLALFALLLFSLGPALAQSLEIVTLKHRTADQVLPYLQPLLEPGAALSGTGDKLFLRAPPANRADILKVLAELDRAARRLMITVRQGSRQDIEAAGAGASGGVVIGSTPGTSGAAVRGQVYGTRGGASDGIVQQVQTVEGGHAWISVGQSMPVPMRQAVLTPQGAVVSESVVYRDVGSGFTAEPRVAGDTVTLDISPTRETPGAQPGSARIQRISTTVSGRLGEWIALGGTSREAASEQSGTARYSTRGGRDERQVWLKVDLLP